MLKMTSITRLQKFRTLPDTQANTNLFAITRPKRGTILLKLSCLITVLTLFLNSHTIARTGSAAENTEKNVQNYRLKIHRLQEGIIKQEDRISQTQAQERTILAEIEVLDKKLSNQVDKLHTLQLNMVKQQELINIEEKALGRIHSEKAIVQNHLKNRITSYYTMGDIGLLNVTFSTKTLPELLSFHDAFDSLIQYDKDVIEVYKETIDELERIKSTLNLERAVLEEFIAQTTEETELLENTKTQKSILLTQVRTQAKLHQQASLEMQHASERLADSIVMLKNKNEIFEQGFMANKGSLPPPVDGILVTLFNQEKTNKLGISKRSQGIELKAKDNTNIIAVSDGNVVFSGYLRGYGNTIVIYHGYKYYTVTSRVEKILVKKGQQIKREQVIGLMGDTATLFDEGLYFEIRKGQMSLDPLFWLNPNRLTALHDAGSSHISGSENPTQPDPNKRDKYLHEIFPEKQQKNF